MRASSTSLLFLASLLPLAFGHGQVHRVITSSGIYTAADAYAAADPTSPLRKLNTYGPAADFTGANITCGEGGNTPVTALAQVNAGSVVTFDWGGWSSVHQGPVMTYIAKCPNGCASFKGDTGNVWVKIDQDGYNPTRASDIVWGEEIIRNRGSVYNVTVPAGLQNGEYILRHELLGLHVASQTMGAQFYPNCLQVKVVNGGSVTLPTGIPLPGSYSPTDPGILVELWRISPSNTSATYTPPGGGVLLKGGSGDWGNVAYGSSSSSSSAATSTTVKPTTTVSSTTSTASTPTSTSGTVVKYGQCGGIGYTGPTACVSGTTCTVLNDYYYQCV